MVKHTLVFLGAGCGGLLRYWIDGLVHQWWGPGFPLGTMVVNVSGCLLIGFLAAAWTGPILVRDEVRVLVLVGLLGGYTTFSTFGRETIALVHDGQWFSAALYVLGSVVLSLGAVWLGWAAATRLYGDGAP